jgi:regulator of protease activity HflC (stomatin/prohibitin superfamily)
MTNYEESVTGVGGGAIVTVVLLSAVALGALSAFGFDVTNYIPIAGGIIVAIIIASGLRIVRPTSRGIVERFGKFRRVQGQGMTWIVPFADKMYAVNITEQMTDAEKQEIITKDKLNATVAALIRYKVKPDEDSIKASQYAVNDYRNQIIQLARTTLRNVIGTKDFAVVNSERNVLNTELRDLISKETEKWGIEIVTFEMKEIEPPKAVQETMNAVIQANNKKAAAVDLAEAAKIEAEGLKNAAIEKASGEKRAFELRAEGEAAAIKTVAGAEAERIEKVFSAAKEHFVEGAVRYREMQVVENSLAQNTKYVLTQEGISPSIILPQESGTTKPATIIPVDSKKKAERRGMSVVDDLMSNM